MRRSKILSTARLLPLAALVLLLVGCGGAKVRFPYAQERMVYPEGIGLPRVFLQSVTDHRPAAQRDGDGAVATIRFPDDRSWARPVVDLYAEALSRDIAQTHLAELVPLPGQADYFLEARIHSFHCLLQRAPLSFALPVAAGMVGGFAWGDDASSRLKRGLVLSVVALGLLPSPTQVRAEVEVELILHDAAGAEVWRQVCIGELDETHGEPAASRRDAHYAESMLPVATKRANACLLGQLRQHLMTGGS